MTEETETQTSQEIESDSQGDTPSFTESDYADSIAESKKYRQRAQRAESKFDKLQKQVEASRQKQMEEQNQWQQLAEERAVKLAEIEPIVEQFKRDEAEQRELILSDFSDEDKEQFGGLSLTQLRNLHKKLFQTKNSVTPTSGTPARSVNPNNKHWTEMSKDERQSNWGDIVKGYALRK